MSDLKVLQGQVKAIKEHIKMLKRIRTTLAKQAAKSCGVDKTKLELAAFDLETAIEQLECSKLSVKSATEYLELTQEADQ